jgi:hypothetical protein
MLLHCACVCTRCYTLQAFSSHVYGGAPSLTMAPRALAAMQAAVGSSSSSSGVLPTYDQRGQQPSSSYGRTDVAAYGGNVQVHDQVYSTLTSLLVAILCVYC